MRDQLVKRLLGFTVPELCDGMGFFRVMDYQIKPRIGTGRIGGYALTVDVPEGESGIVPETILMLKEDDVLVIAGKGNCNYAYWGDHRSLCAKMMGAAGVVIDGAFRDLEGCQEIGFPIFAKALACGTAAKAGTGAINVPVSCGGVCVCPGDLIVGDLNGVCVIKPDEAEAVMERAARKRAAQRAVIEEMERTGVVIPRIRVQK